MYVAALDQGYLSKQDFDRLNAIADETANLIGGLMKYLARSSIPGAKIPALAVPKGINTRTLNTRL
jgi:hypothetical protein